MAIHVLHVLNSAHGGSAISTFEMIDSLKKRGVKSSLVCFNNASPALREKISALVEGRVLFTPLYWTNKKIRSVWWKRPAIELLSLWQTWGGHRYQQAISSLIQQHGVTVIHTSTILNPEGAIAANRNKLPHVWHVRELVGPAKYFQFYNFNKFFNYVLNHSHAIVANSTVTKLCLEDYLPSDKITVVPNSVNITQFSVKTHSNADKLIVAMVGNVTSRLKNHSFFISVAALFADHPNIEFRIYGSLPPETDFYYASLRDQIVKNGLTGKVMFVDFRENPAEIMNEIDILFHPAANESFGRVFIEAMAAGIPVIGINEGGSLEMIKDNVNGFLISENIPEAEVRLTKLLNNPELRNQLGFQGRQLVEQEYTIERMTDRLIQVYQRVTT